ncbi:MAG: type VII toxin-antitoxin system MntA family adenylyltransferase antitoxin [Candidatus Kariarchaeaceae archaeon]
MDESKVLNERDQIRELDIDQFSVLIKPILEKKKIRFGYLFGSFAHGKAFWWSDVDIALSWPEYLEYTGKEKLAALRELIQAIDEILPSIELDLVIFEQQNVSLKFRIIREGKLIFNNDPEYRFNQIEKVMKEYYDYSIWWERSVLPNLKSD